MSRLTEYRQKRYDIMEMLNRLNAKYPDEAKELERKNKCAEKDLLHVWHDLRKNPEDLPPVYDQGDYLSKNVLLDAGIIGYYNFSQKKWCVGMGHRLIKSVSAWCEIPKFEEEIE